MRSPFGQRGIYYDFAMIHENKNLSDTQKFELGLAGVLQFGSNVAAMFARSGVKHQPLFLVC